MDCLLRPVSHKHASNLLSAQLTPISPTMLASKSSPCTVDEIKSPSHTAMLQSPPLIGHIPSNHVQLIQLLGEDVKDFGAWKILLSGESMRNLRQIKRSDGHMFEIVKKKLKCATVSAYITGALSPVSSRELSEGFFSKDNQKRLIGKDTEVPIYEAKMTRDTRLVYTIDCIPESSGDVCGVSFSRLVLTYLLAARYSRYRGYQNTYLDPNAWNSYQNVWSLYSCSNQQSIMGSSCQLVRKAWPRV